MTECEFLLGIKEYLEINIKASKERCARFEEKLEILNQILEGYQMAESGETAIDN